MFLLKGVGREDRGKTIGGRLYTGISEDWRILVGKNDWCGAGQEDECIYVNFRGQKVTKNFLTKRRFSGLGNISWYFFRIGRDLVSLVYTTLGVSLTWGEISKSKCRVMRILNLIMEDFNFFDLAAGHRKAISGHGTLGRLKLLTIVAIFGGWEL